MVPSEPAKLPHLAGVAGESLGSSSSQATPLGAPAPLPALDGLPALSVGIRVKLIALMVAMTLVVVVSLATYFSAREIGELRVKSHDRAKVYAGLASQQLRSAVAFEDRETAREVIGSIARDPLIEGIAVYTAQGRQLHGEGSPSELARRARVGLGRDLSAFYLPGRVLAVAPVRSLEGATGTLVLELSTRDAHDAQRRLTVGALWIGSLALLSGAIMAWLIARSLARRVEVVAEAAFRMSGGELDHLVDVSGPNDEIGLLSHGFNAMNRKVRELLAHIQTSAREESARLEQLVAQRTDQLDRRNHDLRLVLDNVEQGFVTVDREGRVVGEYSLAIRRWLGELDPSETLWQKLSTHPEQAALFAVAWEQVIDDLMPLEVALDQMPLRLELAGRQLSLEYRPLAGEPFERLLVVISDITAVVARESVEQESRDLINLTTHLLQDRAGFLEFFQESQRLFDSIDTNLVDLAKLKRDIHTLKGNSALYGLTRVSTTCHELEVALQDHTPETLDRSALSAHWAQCSSLAKRLLGKREITTIEIGEQEYLAALEAIRRGAPAEHLERLMHTWKLEPLRARLDRVAEQLVHVAASLGKGQVAVQVTADNLYLGRDELGEFWAAFSHVVRNAAVHGLETPEERVRVGKASRPRFALQAGIDRDRLFVELADSGPGIDWEGVRARATARGIPHSTQAELEEALFVDGLSTRADVTELSGRGVGLSAVRAACVRRQGSVRVTTLRGAGTSFRFSWPATQFPTLVRLQQGGAP